ncbi:MAG: hypothetical protein FWE63_08745 [Bacteroidales bacterium]|nr:hypothetical protein [Bacteroidales bacterium]
MMKDIVAQPIEDMRIEGTHPFRLYTREDGLFDFLPKGMFAIPAKFMDLDHEYMKIVSYFIVDAHGNGSMIEYQVPQNEMWCCSRKNAILARWIIG